MILALLAAAALHAPVRDVLTLPRPEATAAYAVDPSVAEASVESGAVTIVCRSPGSTLIAIVQPQGVETVLLVVDRPPPGSFLERLTAPQQGASWEALYDSGAQRLSNAIAVFDGGRERSVWLRAVDVTRIGDAATGDARTSLPFLSLEVARDGRRLTLFDETVEASPLTLDGTSLRGAHFEGGGLALHAGVTSPLLYQGVLLPAQAETAAGASYTVRGFTPSLYWFPSGSSYGGASGALAALMYELGKPDDRLHLRAEAAWGGRPGAALELSWLTRSDRFTLSARHQPEGIASIGVGRPHGSFLEASLSDHTFSRLTADFSTSLERHELPSFVQISESATAELRFLLGAGFSLVGGGTAGAYRSGGARVQSLTLPVGIAWDSERTGASAVYRWERNSASNAGGSGARVSLRHGLAGFSAGAYGDLQQDAATVDLVFRDDPALAQAFAALGLDAQTPDDLARILRDHPELAQLGYVEGATVDLHPWRVQAGGDLTWQPDAGHQLRLLLQLDRRRSVARDEQTAMSTLSFRSALGRAVELIGSGSIWTRDGASGWSVVAGFRVHADSLPSLGGSTVQATVSTDDGRGVGGVRVRLDGGREAITDADGEVEFRGAAAGKHRLTVVLPEGAYFTTRSTIEVFGGESARFGLCFSPARVSGVVHDDAGLPVAGAVLRLGPERATTDSNGRYSFALAAGAYTLSLDSESLPPGYDAASTLPVSLRLEPAAPRQIDFDVQAERSIAGVVVPGAQQVAVWVAKGPSKAVADLGGHFLLRHLKAGPALIEADVDGRVLRSFVDVPAAPIAIRGVVLAIPR